MRCPYLEEVVMCYCQAYPVKKLVPASSSQLVSPCYSNPGGCPIHREIKGVKEPLVESRETPVPQTQRVSQSGEKKYCVWVRQETISYRLCTRDYDCQSCSFEQTLLEQDGKYIEPLDVVNEVERLRRLPVSQRRCKYSVTGKILLEPCDMNYECWKCPLYQGIRTSIIENYIAEAKKQ